MAAYMETLTERNERDAQREEMDAQHPRARLFIRYYLESLNEHEAAERAGYARGTGKSLLQKAGIKAEIEKGLGLVHMSASEIVARLSVFARSSIDDFLGPDGLVDLNKARELKVMGVLKKLKYDSHGMPEIELENRQEAMEKLGKILGMFVERMQIDSNQVISIDANRQVMAAAMSDPLTLARLIETAELVKRAGGRAPVDVARLMPGDVGAVPLPETGAETEAETEAEAVQNGPEGV